MGAAMVTSADAARDVGLSRDNLSKLARAGKIPGHLHRGLIFPIRISRRHFERSIPKALPGFLLNQAYQRPAQPNNL
jgi:hypothetical protein